jgi:hypothetical protein
MYQLDSQPNTRILLAYANLQKGNSHPDRIQAAFVSFLLSHGQLPDLVATVETGAKFSRGFGSNVRASLNHLGLVAITDTLGQQSRRSQTDLWYNADTMRHIGLASSLKLPMGPLQFNHGLVHAVMQQTETGLVVPVIVPHVTSGPSKAPLDRIRFHHVERIATMNAGGIAVGDYNPGSGETAILERIAQKHGQVLVPFGDYMPKRFEPFKMAASLSYEAMRIVEAVYASVDGRISTHSRDFVMFDPHIWNVVSNSLIIEDIGSDHPAALLEMEYRGHGLPVYHGTSVGMEHLA